MPVSATIADWVSWLDFTSLEGMRKCLKINNRTGEGTAWPVAVLASDVTYFSLLMVLRGCVTLRATC
jgi:hypothetical protein